MLSELRTLNARRVRFRAPAHGCPSRRPGFMSTRRPLRRSLPSVLCSGAHVPHVVK